MSRAESNSCDLDDLLSGINADVILAAEDVDTTLIDWLLSLSPLERVAWAQRQATMINGLRYVEV